MRERLGDRGGCIQPSYLRRAARAADGSRSRVRAALLITFLATTLALPAAAQPSVAIGLDHIPVAVNDLDRASATFRALGFALKPGRPHTNGIRNAHVKFPDGAGIELVSAATATDALAAHYAALLRAGEGPAFLTFHARDSDRLHATLRAGGHAFRPDGGITTLQAPEFADLFFVRDNRSPTDRPEHFAHPNGAVALSAVWIATEHGEALAELLVRLGGTRERQQVLAPDPVEATVVTLAEGEVIILSERYQVIPGRSVIGARFAVPDLARVRRIVAEARIAPRGGAGAEDRVVVDPGAAHGLWLEFVTSPTPSRAPPTR